MESQQNDPLEFMVPFDIYLLPITDHCMTLCGIKSHIGRGAELVCEESTTMPITGHAPGSESHFC